MMRALRFVRWTAIALIVVLATGLGVRRVLRHEPRPARSRIETIGGAFQLTDDRGAPVTEATYRGRWMLVFFGYTHCPDECPLTLQKMAMALRHLGTLAPRVAPLFITVDPARDTPARLKSYLARIDPRLIGLTGTGARIAAAAGADKVYYAPGAHEQSGTDRIDHTTLLYLMTPRGRLDEVLPADIGAAQLTGILRAKVAGGS